MSREYDDGFNPSLLVFQVRSYSVRYRDELVGNKLMGGDVRV